MNDQSFRLYIRHFLARTGVTYWILVRVVVPAMLVVKIASELGLVQDFADLLSPVLGLIGLPGEAAIVWATALVTNLFAGVAVFLQIATPDTWTTAQVSVLGLMMLFAHALPVECAVARMSGLPAWYSITLRVGAALLSGYLTMLTLSTLGLWQAPVTTEFSALYSAHAQSLSAWILSQLKTLATIYVVITVMTLVLDLIRRTGFDRVIARVLTPFFRVIGCRSAASDMTIVGLTLGLSYGAGLMVQEAKSANVSAYDRTSVLSFLSLSHSLIEDTLVIALMGGSLLILLFVRLLFTFALVIVLRIGQVFTWLAKMEHALA
ncbi:nucleoside recognition domain-containing protein [Salinisphaera sp. RV14]|uniref:nucleoside recognition domain-containing protein n=1 Tax=Salinisphaera sp. RV14 TaxID=3454140 RepID=UPI003F840D01